MNINDIYEIFKKYPRIETDTRKDVKDSIFFALKGENSNGNRYVSLALEKGAAFAVADDKTLAKNDRIIFVDDSLKTLQDLALFHRTQLGIPVLAITGSNGKTTTKELVWRVLKNKFNVAATQGNFNNHIGVALTLLLLKKENNFAVIEMGTNHFGEINTLTAIAKPNFGLINSVGKCHLEFFGDLNGVAKAKGEMFEYLAANNGVFFANTDIPQMPDVLKLHSYNEKNVEEYNRVKYNVRLLPSDSPYLKFAFNDVDVQTNLIGEYNIGNALSAIAVGKHFGISDTDIATSIASYKPDNLRSEFRKTANNDLYLDTYNANPTSMQASLQNFMKLPMSNKMLVLGDMREVGESSAAEHLNIVEMIKSSEIKDVLLVGHDFTEAAAKTPFKCFANVGDCIDYIKKNKILNRTILIKGSHSMQLEKTIEYL